METNDRYDSLGPGFEQETHRKNSPVPIWVLLFLVISLLLTGVSMVRFPKVFGEYRIYVKAEQRMREGETSDALNDLLGVVETHPNSVPLIVKLIDLSMEAGYYDSAAYALNEFLAGKELNDTQYARMMRHTERLEAYFLTYDVLDNLFADMAEMTEEEASQQQIEDICEALKSLLYDENQDQAMLYYYLATFSQSSEEYYTYIKQGYELDPELFDIRVQLGNAARTNGYTEEAKEYLLEALAKDKKDSGALRGLAVLSLLAGDAEEGLEYAMEAYELYPDGTYVRDTCLIALHVNGKSEEEAAMLAEIQEIEGELEEDTKQFLEDACTLQEYYIRD